MDVAAFWTEKGQTELANLYKHTLEIPMRVLESALKTGKPQFQWREARAWLRLASGNSMPTLPDDLVVELPLALIAPRFLEQRGIGKPRKRIEPSADIPDLFAQKAAPPVPSAPPAAVEAPQQMAPAVREIKPDADYPEIFNEPNKREWTFNEVMRKTAELPGATGAVLATSDGLLIAGTWPDGVTGEAVAGFLPQMHGRMLQYSKELKLGEPEEFGFNVGDVPLQIFKMNNCYFAVLGRAGKDLPKRELAALFLRLKKSSNAK
jgi:predicted regulator of Ras-like GTPase activity (Roadblock/LC7/MglB family)